MLWTGRFVVRARDHHTPSSTDSGFPSPFSPAASRNCPVSGCPQQPQQPGGHGAECAVLVPFGIGVLVGIFAIAKLIEFLLARFETYTYCAVLGLVAASPISIFTAFRIPRPSFFILILSPIALAAGFAAAYFLGKHEDREVSEQN